jgi:hypothetical protein
VAWYHEGRFIDVTSDTRYTVISQGFYLYISTLTITRLEAALLGRYDVMLTVGNVNHSDTVQLEFASEKHAALAIEGRTELSSDVTIKKNSLADGF